MKKTLIERVLEKLYIPDDKEKCWIWTGAKHKQGYGSVFTSKGKTELAHRIMWRHFNYSEIPDGLNVLHSCDNTSCCNPKHLELGTQRKNILDMFERNRDNRVYGERQWNHKLSTFDVQEIRKLYKNGIRSADIAEKFQIHRTTVIRIVSGKSRRLS